MDDPERVASERLHRVIGYCNVCTRGSLVDLCVDLLDRIEHRGPTLVAAQPVPELRGRSVSTAPWARPERKTGDAYRADPDLYCAATKLGRSPTREAAADAASRTRHRSPAGVAMPELLTWACPHCHSWHYSGLKRRDAVLARAASS